MVAREGGGAINTGGPGVEVILQANARVAWPMQASKSECMDACMALNGRY